MERIGQRATAEFIGTFALVFIACGSVIVAQGVAGTLGVALAQGLVLAVFVSVLAHLSGAHFNPAVTIGAWVTNQIQTAAAGVYIFVQLVAATAAAYLLRVVVEKQFWDAPNIHLGTTQVNHTLTTNGRAVALEAILTFFLVFAVYGTAIDERGPFTKIAGLSIGLVLTFDILFGGPFTGGAMNPARWFGPALASGTWTDWWVYLIGPIGGGVIAASVYWFAFLGGREKLVRLPRTEKPIEGPETPMAEPGEGVTGLPGAEG